MKILVKPPHHVLRNTAKRLQGIDPKAHSFKRATQVETDRKAEMKRGRVKHKNSWMP